MASMLAAAVAAALAVYVAVQAARGVRAPIPVNPSADQMAVQERRDGSWICVGAVAFSLGVAALAVHVGIAPGAAAQMEAGSGLRLAVLSAGGVLVSAFSLRETAHLSRADKESDIYRMREVPLVYAALVWAALGLNYAIALA